MEALYKGIIVFRSGMKVIRIVAGEENTCPVGTIGTVIGYYGKDVQMDVRIDFLPHFHNIWGVRDVPYTLPRYWKPYSKITKTKELK